MTTFRSSKSQTQHCERVTDSWLKVDHDGTGNISLVVCLTSTGDEQSSETKPSQTTDLIEEDVLAVVATCSPVFEDTVLT